MMNIYLFHATTAVWSTECICGACLHVFFLHRQALRVGSALIHLLSPTTVKPKGVCKAESFPLPTSTSFTLLCAFSSCPVFLSAYSKLELVSAFNFDMQAQKSASMLMHSQCRFVMPGGDETSLFGARGDAASLACAWWWRNLLPSFHG